MTSKRSNTLDSGRPAKRIKSSTTSKKLKTKQQRNGSTTKAGAAAAKIKLPRKQVRVDSLRWQEVSMPDRLDDIEGFMGLEEVDDVEIVRNDDGLVEFRVADRKDEEDIVDSEGEGEAEEWNGFGDDEVAESSKEKEAKGVQNSESKEGKEEKKKEQKKKKNTKDANGASASKSNGSAPGNQFTALTEETVDDDVPTLEDWTHLNLSDETIRSLAKLKFTTPTKIQSAAIPHIIAGRDVIGKASTGSGKTLAFAIPIFEHWLSVSDRFNKDNKLVGEDDDGASKPKGIKSTSAEAKFSHPPTALIISPTRELAHQITSHITDLTNNSSLPSPPRTVSLTGGLSVQKQCRQLTQFGGADIVVATPGRLWEVLSSGKGYVDWFRKVRFLVVDEADRVLQDGHFKEVEDVMDILVREEDGQDDGTESEEKGHGEQRQTLVFSATFSRDLQQKLAKHSVKGRSGGGLMGGKETMEYLLEKLPFREDHPQMIDVNPVAQMAENLREGIVECGSMEKDLYLYFLLLRFPLRTLVFANSISTVRRLASFLSNLQLSAHPLHSSMIQKARLRSLERFASSSASTGQSSNSKAGEKATKENERPSILISTDVAARGLDIKGVEMVVHYHVPRTADAYVHRSGRTARAEHRGVSVLLCSPDEVAGVRRLIARIHVQHSSSSSSERELKTVSVDRTLVSRLKPRVDLSQRITASTMAQTAQRLEDDWLKNAAEELGVDYSSDEFEANAKKGRGGQRGKEKRKKAGAVTKDEMAVMRARLNEELKRKVGGGSRLYLTFGKGGENLAQRLVDGKEHDAFFGEEGGWGLDELLE